MTNKCRKFCYLERLAVTRRREFYNLTSFFSSEVNVVIIIKQWLCRFPANQKHPLGSFPHYLIMPMLHQSQLFNRTFDFIKKKKSTQRSEWSFSKGQIIGNVVSKHSSLKEWKNDAEFDELAFAAQCVCLELLRDFTWRFLSVVSF